MIIIITVSFLSEDERKNFGFEAQRSQWAHDGTENDKQAVEETANISKPIQQTVSLPLNFVDRLAKLEPQTIELVKLSWVLFSWELFEIARLWCFKPDALKIDLLRLAVLEQGDLIFKQVFVDEARDVHRFARVCTYVLQVRLFADPVLAEIILLEDSLVIVD